MIYVFIDTNVFLHYRRLREINWNNLLKSAEVSLILAPVTIRELDKAKDLSPSQKLRARAREALADLRVFMQSGQVREHVGLKVIAHDPDIDFKAHRLHTELADDWLIASVIQFQVEDPNASVVVCTADSGLEFKAPAFQLQIVRPPAESALADEIDLPQRRIKQLETEVSELKNALPELRLIFPDGTNILKIQSPLKTEVGARDIETEIANLAREYPEKSAPSPREPKRSGVTPKRSGVTLAELAAFEFTYRPAIPVIEYERYNQERQTFLEEYRNYLKESSDHENVKKRTIRFEVRLRNDGGTPADDIDVHMHFPDGFRLLLSKKLPQAPQPPKPPRPPGHHNIPDLLSSMQFDVPSFGLGPPNIASNVSSPHIIETGSYDVNQHVRKLKHGYSERLATFAAIFESCEAVNSFSIDYSISAANHPRKMSGQMSIVLE